jgi:shikimate kinase
MAISLIGYRGTGKSTVGHLIAQQFGCKFVDIDSEIELRAGKSIAAMFADEGENAFRELECAIVREFITSAQTVVALGGGTILREENRAVIKRSGPVVWLMASPETLAERIAADASTAERRPNLTSQGGITEIIAMLRIREPLYRECAKFVVDTEGKTPATVADEIVSWLRSGDGERDSGHSV